MKQADRSDHMGHHDALKAIDHAGSKLNKHGPDHDNYKQAMTKAKQASKKAMSMNNESVNYESVGMSEKSSVNYKDIDGKTVNEISKDLTTAYLKGRARGLYFTGKKAGQDDVKAMVGAPTPSYRKGPERKASMMMRSMDRALGKLTGKAKVPAQGKKGKNVRDQY